MSIGICAITSELMEKSKPYIGLEVARQNSIPVTDSTRQMISVFAHPPIPCQRLKRKMTNDPPANIVANQMATVLL
jgi:hypothetical protein